jgi:hypothetical protein
MQNSKKFMENSVRSVSFKIVKRQEIDLKIRIKIESLSNLHQIHSRQIGVFDNSLSYFNQHRNFGKEQVSDSNLSSEPFNSINAVSSKFYVKSFILKRKLILTTLSSPHVHKKSREQYKLDYYKTYYTCSVTNSQDYTKFMQFKLNLYEFYSNHGLAQSQNIVCTYQRKMNLQGFLPS